VPPLDNEYHDYQPFFGQVGEGSITFSPMKFFLLSAIFQLYEAFDPQLLTFIHSMYRLDRSLLDVSEKDKPA